MVLINIINFNNHIIIIMLMIKYHIIRMINHKFLRIIDNIKKIIIVL